MKATKAIISYMRAMEDMEILKLKMRHIKKSMTKSEREWIDAIEEMSVASGSVPQERFDSDEVTDVDVVVPHPDILKSTIWG